MNVSTALRPYEHPWEHITDELRRLDVLIEAGLRSMTAPADDPALDPFRGLVVTETEAKQLLQDDGRFALLQDDERQELDAWDDYIASRVAASEEAGVPLPLKRLQSAFRLDDGDLRRLVAAMAPDVDRKYEKLYAYLQDDMTSKFATVDLLLRLCCGSEKERRDALPRLLPHAPLAALLRKEPPDATRSALARAVRADERIVAFALGLEWTYAGNMSAMRRYDADDSLPSLLLDQDVGDRLEAHLRAASEATTPVVYLIHGPTGGGKTLHARRAAGAIGMGLLEWDAGAAPSEEEPFKEALDVALREARLIGAVPAVDRLHALTAAGDRRGEWLAERLRGLEGPAFLLSERAWQPERPIEGAAWVDVPLRLPDPSSRRRLWRAAVVERFPLPDAEASALAAKFRFTPGRIERTVRTAERLLEWERKPGAAAEPPGDAKALHRAGYMQVRHRLGEKAVRLEPKFAWDDLILPDDTKSLLRQACNRLLYRNVVFGDWGFERKFAYGKGISMLFTGPPGTGKTMSAMVMAREMDAELYRIDLSRMVSKYIGETEKNLSEIFDEAQLSGAILFFDEADALFGKRSEVKDAHDKYANMETSYLLQKMEEYDGLTILATNFAQNLDEAFTRRIQFIVRYPFPDPAQREQLWRSTFPNESPVVHDIDFEYLSRTFDLAGGPIKNVVLTAAFLAAEEGVPIGMKHMIESIKQEYKKTGKVLLKDRLGAYAD
jgi:AAA+ superfamily predicted ATPase